MKKLKSVTAFLGLIVVGNIVLALLVNGAFVRPNRKLTLDQSLMIRKPMSTGNDVARLLKVSLVQPKSKENSPDDSRYSPVVIIIMCKNISNRAILLPYERYSMPHGILSQFLFVVSDTTGHQLSLTNYGKKLLEERIDYRFRKSCSWSGVVLYPNEYWKETVDARRLVAFSKPGKYSIMANFVPFHMNKMAGHAQSNFVCFVVRK